MIKLLSDCGAGERGTVKRVSGAGRVRRRLLDMGVTPDAEFAVRKKAPLGDPVEITLRGYELTVRKSEAACVEVETE